MNDSGCCRRKVSLSLVGATATGTNSDCHGSADGVKANDKHVMRRPNVLPIFWGKRYASNPMSVTLGVQLLTDLVTGAFMNSLAQYGVGVGTISQQVTIGTDPAAQTWDSFDTKDRDQLIKWLDDGTIATKPAMNETNLLYCIFLPTNLALVEWKGQERQPHHRRGRVASACYI